MSAFIGGNLAAIDDSAKRIDQSADMAMTSGESTASAANVLQEAVSGAMSDLVQRFEAIAGDMETDITATHTQLVSADWQGASRDNAVAIKEQLQSQINTVLGNAKANLSAEQRAFTDRANAIVDSVNNEFKGVMRQVDTQYRDLASASRQTKENLLAADATIRM